MTNSEKWTLAFRSFVIIGVVFCLIMISRRDNNLMQKAATVTATNQPPPTKEVTFYEVIQGTNLYTVDWCKWCLDTIQIGWNPTSNSPMHEIFLSPANGAVEVTKIVAHTTNLNFTVTPLKRPER